ncbi:hypothetical protein [Streptomyces sp. KMM 9044]|uniref:hypothetical protein n=1 Tax=Streptomyces sp. KMM 9044 TaxID=2744474 RepID=UPI00215159D7|nr:hypothetical protein [Streptomyces sp. KMM 9044]WAX78594.1 hypothetical protein HUV60_013810 [Streptomyces sp. KMM 9044]
MAKLPWREIPVQDRSHGREEVREVKVANVDNLLFPHTKQVVRIHRRRHRLGTKKWSTETVHAVTDLAAHQADAAEIAAWARGHWMIEVRREAFRYRTGVRDPWRPAVAAAR